jgi:hypothetical protein
LSKPQRFGDGFGIYLFWLPTKMSLLLKAQMHCNKTLAIANIRHPSSMLFLFWPYKTEAGCCMFCFLLSFVL